MEAERVNSVAMLIRVRCWALIDAFASRDCMRQLGRAADGWPVTYHQFAVHCLAALARVYAATRRKSLCRSEQGHASTPPCVRVNLHYQLA